MTCCSATKSPSHWREIERKKQNGFKLVREKFNLKTKTKEKKHWDKQVLNDGKDRASEREREHDEPREVGSDTAGRLRKHPPLRRLMDSADTAPLQSLRLLLCHAFFSSLTWLLTCSLPPFFFPSLALLLSLSPRGAGGLCRAGLHETAAPLSGREEHGKKAKPCGERALQNKHKHTDAELRKLSFFLVERWNKSESLLHFKYI